MPTSNLTPVCLNKKYKTAQSYVKRLYSAHHIVQSTRVLVQFV